MASLYSSSIISLTTVRFVVVLMSLPTLYFPCHFGLTLYSAGGLYIFALVAGVRVAFLHKPMSALVSFIFALVAVIGVAFCTLSGVGVGIF